MSIEPAGSPAGSDLGHVLRSPGEATQWKLFLILLAAPIVAAVAIIPYTIDLMGQTSASPAITVEWQIVIQIITNLILSVPTVAIGVWLGPRIGLTAPLLTTWLAGERSELRRLLTRTVPAAAVGIALGALVAGASILISPRFPSAFAPVTAPSPLHGFLAAISAGITEEIWLRFGIMTFLAWLFFKVHPGSSAMWLANVLAALAFAALHLPLAGTLMPLTGLVLAWVLTVNGALGIGFGWLYWRRGLEAAVMAHFAADVVLHALAPALGSA